MRIYKPTYGKALPKGAKIFTRKGKQFVKFKDSKDHIAEARLTKKRDKILLETKNWHINFEDNRGIRRRLKLFTNRQATQRAADKIQDLLDTKANNLPLTDELQKWLEQIPNKIRNELIKFELLDSRSTSAGKKLTEFVEEFRDYLTKKERNPGHIRDVAGTLNRIFDKCGFVTWMDISPDRLKDFLDGLRDEGRGISKRRYNALLKIAKFFCKWMVKQKKAASSPIAYLDGLDNPQTDRRHPRRVLELNDFRRFLDATLTGPEKFGLTGYERSLVYRVAVETALRKCDLQRLQIRDCNFKKGMMIIKAGRIKNKQRSFIYLKPETAIELEQYCVNKLPETKVFRMPDKTEKMVQFDLANASIPYVDDSGEYFDFHSLRHQSASLYGMNPDTPEAVRQQLTRHKSPAMARHYTHASEWQQRAAVEALPDLRRPHTEKQTAAKTGTDDKILSKSCFSDAHLCDLRTPVDRPTAIQDAKTPLCANNKPEVQTTEPKVACSSHARRIF